MSVPIEIDSVLPGLLALAVAFAVAHLIAGGSRFYRGVLGAQATGRYGEIDGLRGFLAPAVFLSHVVSSYYWYRSGHWGWPPSTLYTLCGTAPVSLFFMVTGFLFWRRAAAAPGRMDVTALLRSRLRRLAPLYLSCIAVVLAVVGVETRWTLAVPPLALAASLAEWTGFGLFGFPDINGLAHTRLVDPALWTLRYEWFFYLALPGLSFLATPRRLAGLGLTVAVLSLTGLLAPLDYVSANFLAGMTVAQVAVARPLPAMLKSPGAAVLALLPAIGFGLLGDGDFSVLESLSLAPLFAVVAAGNDLFGTLSSRAARCLGLVSYSTYTVHGLVLYLALAAASRFVAVGELAPAAYWALMLPVSAAVVALSAAGYRWIEHPFLGAPAPAAVTPPTGSGAAGLLRRNSRDRASAHSGL
jgi:peptidoglycan/LPS O-acetylase OafA/YrhL